MTTMFRAYAEDELPNLELRTTKDEALMDAITRITAERGTAGHPPTIIVDEVREPTFSDFFDFRQLMSLMRESMADKIGNDDALTDDAIAKLSAQDDGYIAAALDDVASNTGLRIDGYIVVNRARAERWWVRGSDDQ